MVALLDAKPVVDREAWLQDRLTGIGASEAAAVMGWSPYAGPMEIYLRKVGQMPEQEADERMEIGLLVEPVIQELFQRRTGQKIGQTQIFVRDADRPHIFATIDGITEDGEGVEFKNMDAFAASRELGEEGSDQVPDHWIIQAHQGMKVTGLDRWRIAVLIGGNRFKLFFVERQDSILDAMLPALDQFWAQVQTRTPPLDIGPIHSKLLKVLYPDCEGEVELGSDGLAVVAHWQGAVSHAKDADADKDAARDKLLALLGNAAVGRLPDGRVVTRKLITVNPRTVTLAQVQAAGGELEIARGYTRTDLRVKEPKGLK